MAKSFCLKACRLNDLTQVIGSLSPQEIAKVKPDEPVKANVRVEKLYTELEEANKEYMVVLEQILKVSEPYREQFKKEADFIKTLGLPEEEEKAKLLAKAEEVNEVIKKLVEEKRKEINAEAAEEKVVTVTIASNDRYTFLKEIFEKLAADKYLQRKAMVETFEALDAAKEE